MDGTEAHRGTPTSRRFRFHECLGRGGHGEVYRGSMYRDGGVASEVALKVLAVDVEPQSDPVHRLHDEGRLLGALNHPGLLKVFDLVELDGRVALVTEYVEGQDLHQAIYQGGVPVKVLVEVVGQLAEALHAAWTTASPTGMGQLRLVHRDIKPQNVRLGVHGEVKLLDFGIARALNDVQRESHTKNDIMMGSWPYLAPERMLEQPADLSSAVDVYGLGCVLFEGLAGQRLMEGQSLFGLYRVVDIPGAFDELVHARVQNLAASVPHELRMFLHRLLAENPAERPSAYQTGCLCEELAERLTGPGLRRWARERRWPANSKEPGPLTGRDMAESTGPADRAGGLQVSRAPIPAPSLPTPPAIPQPPAPAVRSVSPRQQTPPPLTPAGPPRQTWTPPAGVTRPRTPSLPPSLEGWMPPPDPTPAPAVAVERARVQRPVEAGAIVINDLGRHAVGVAEPTRPRATSSRSVLPFLGLFVVGLGLFGAAGAGVLWIVQDTDTADVASPGLTPAALTATEGLAPVAVPVRVPEPEPAGLVREEVRVEPSPEAEPDHASNAAAREPAPAPAPRARPQPVRRTEAPPAIEARPALETASETEPVLQTNDGAPELMDLVTATPPPEPSTTPQPAGDVPPILDSRDARGATVGSLPAPEAPVAEAPEALGLPEPAADLTPGVLVVQGDALVELRGEFGAFRLGTPMLPGTYEVWADYGAGFSATGLSTRMVPGGTITVSCSVKAARCFVSPRLD